MAFSLPPNFKPGRVSSHCRSSDLQRGSTLAVIEEDMRMRSRSAGLQRQTS